MREQEQCLSGAFSMARALFLFNHDAAHQVAHLAPVAAATAREHRDIETTIAYATPALRARIEQMIDPADATRIIWEELELGETVGRLCGAFDRLLPASRLARLRVYEPLFRRADAVVSTERTCLRVQQRLGPQAAPLFIRVPHGTGDRSVTFHPDHRRFDLSLVAGPKIAEQLAANGVHAERIRVTGYSKFERIDLSAKPDYFGNGRPTFVYNPHFDPYLSSWYDAGPDLLAWFASPEGQHYNLIFAPHVMLFRKTTHVSPEYRIVKRRPDIPSSALAAENILIDVDGPKLFDMSYMLSADCYIGDTSSQIYEFLVRPRPTFLLDPNGALAEQGETDLPFLGTGPVIRNPADLADFLEAWKAVGERFRPHQQELIDHTFSLTDTPPSVRAANAIAEAIRNRTP